MPKKDVLARINALYDDLSESQKRIADFVLDNPKDSAYISIGEMAVRTSTSPATVSRFSIKMGCDGYVDFQQSIYYEEVQTVPFSSMKNLFRKTAEEEERENALKWTIQQNCSLLEQFYTPALEETLKRVRDIIRNSRRVFVIGMGSSYTVAYYLTFMLRRMRENVILLGQTDSGLTSQLNELSEKDCLVTVTYSRYTKITCEIINFFREKECPIVAFTDDKNSVLSRKVTEIIKAPKDDFYAPVAAIAACSALLELLRREDAENMLKRMEEQNKIAEKLELYQ